MGNKLNKSPAFQFYPADWLSSEKMTLMTPAQEGAYIRLLCYAWQSEDCGLPDNDDSLAQLSRLGEGWFKGGSSVVRECFRSEGGRLFNDRLLEERKKQVIWREKSSQGGRASAKVRKQNKLDAGKGGSTTVLRVVQPKGNSSSSSSSSLSKKEREHQIALSPSPEILSDPLEPYPTLRDKYSDIRRYLHGFHPKVRQYKLGSKQELEDRAALADLVRLDKFTEGDVIDTFRWLFTDMSDDGEFWRLQIRALKPIRKIKKGDATHKFTKIYEGMKASKGKQMKPRTQQTAREVEDEKNAHELDEWKQQQIANLTPEEREAYEASQQNA